ERKEEIAHANPRLPSGVGRRRRAREWGLRHQRGMGVMGPTPRPFRFGRGHRFLSPPPRRQGSAREPPGPRWGALSAVGGRGRDGESGPGPRSVAWGILALGVAR